MSFLRELIALVLQLGGLYLTSLGFVGAGQILFAAAAAVSLYDVRRERSKARRGAREQWNASQKDRLQMVDLQRDQARSLVLGRVRAVDGVRDSWTSGVHSEVLTFIVSFAGHEIDGYEGFYADTTLLTVDAQGWVRTQPWMQVKRETQLQSGIALDGTGGASYDFGPLAVGQTYVPDSAAAMARAVGGSLDEVHCTVVVTGTVATISGGQAFGLAELTWQLDVEYPKLRIREYTGAAGQNVGNDIAGEYPGKVTATDEFADMAVAVIDFYYDQDAYPQGLPSISALMRGAKVYDPRLDSTVPGGSGSHRVDDPSTWAWSANPALCFSHYMRHANGGAVPAADISIADTIAAANACDVSTDFTLRMPDTSTEVVNLPRYRCGTYITFDAEPAKIIDQIMLSMYGRWGWAGGTLRFRAGVMASPVATIDASWVASIVDDSGVPDQTPVVRISNGVPPDARVNRVTGTCMDPAERWQLLPFPAVEDATMIANDGAVYATEVDMEAVTHHAHAQHIGTLFIKGTLASLRMELLCNMSAFSLELFDVVNVTLPRYGMTNKTFEVVAWTFQATTGVRLGLAEITTAMFTPEAELRGRDPAPNGDLRDPADVERITGVTVSSGTAPLSDGSIITRTRVQWNAATQQSVRFGGRIQVQYALIEDADADEWLSVTEQGAATETIIPGLLTQRVYVFRVRAEQVLPPVFGPWSTQVAHKINAAPSVAPGSYMTIFEDADGIGFSNFS